MYTQSSGWPHGWGVAHIGFAMLCFDRDGCRARCPGGVGSSCLPYERRRRLNLQALGSAARKEFSMADIACIAASILCFLIAIAYTNGCDRLAVKAGKP